MIGTTWNRIRWIVALMPLLMLAAPALADAKLDERVRNATEIYRELLKEPDRGVPEALLAKARAIAVIPHVLQGAIGYGGRFGRGVITCREPGGAWSPISFVTLAGGSIGFQLGGESADVVLFFMTDRGVRSMISSKFTLGGKASVAAGPMGRSAEASTDVRLDAEIYSYAKAKGLFAGISIEGARLAPDEKSNAAYYGKKTTAETLLFAHQAPTNPAAVQDFLKTLPH